MVLIKPPARKSTGGRTFRGIPNKSLSSVHHASTGGKAKILKALLKGGQADMEKRDNYFRTPLHHAAINGCLETVELLLAHDASVNVRDSSRRTPLHYAIISRSYNVVELLLAHKASAATQDQSHQTPLHYAVNSGCIKTVELLLANKSPFTTMDRDSRTPLAYASRYGELEILKLLLKNVPSASTPWVEARTPLHYAARHGFVDIAKIQLENKIPLQVQDENNQTALENAVKGKHWEVVELLLEEGRRLWVSSQPQDTNNPMTTIADDEAVLLALKMAAEGQIHGDCSPLEVAARLGWENMIRRLFNEHGCRPKNTQLSLAVQNGHQRCVEMLLSRCAEIDAPDLECSESLRCALEFRHDSIAGILLSAGANPFVGGSGRSHNYINRTVKLLMMREPSVVAQLLFHVSSIEVLSRFLIGIASSKRIDIIQEYFRTVVPNVTNKYVNQPASAGITKLVQYLVQRRDKVVNRADDLARKANIHRTFLGGLKSNFDGVFILISVIEPETLGEILDTMPIIRETAEGRLPYFLDYEADKNVIAWVLKTGCILPALTEDGRHR